MLKSNLLSVTFLIAILQATLNSSAQQNHQFHPGRAWLDTDGNHIQAHGGGIMFHDGTYYWYGTNMDGPTYREKSAPGWECYRVDVIGVSCYSSKDLYNWKHEGVVLRARPEHAAHDLHPRMVCERPKVVRNPKTKQFVMWMHIDNANYKYARTGVAVSESPTGPFKYIHSMRPNNAESRDMTLFQDDDGKAYLIYSSNDNGTLEPRANSTTHISLLTEDYLNQSGTFRRVFINKWREAPALFKHDDKYYMISSACTGWSPNAAEIAVADNIFGEWTVLGNPCLGPDSDKTFYSQSTFVLPVQGKKNGYIFMADRWIKKDLGSSKYIWLPIQIKDNQMIIEWEDEWDLGIFE
jgi:hypothetical protein